ncbi:hypothetical protein FAES_3993 [Fibrella aestuarina BUZ 2]|uniref:Polysaccharide biosynthesis protein n=1 Tax=Fibrella aestuarina BUZ 2 TaxID=1166018 RepID=I0KCZ1_9BACT|nr:hypothetical protein [Fibrella aestuarina]CCH01994.1 hypothetical protein FAES_3993 [Fibrella aestuarina BUZ 2]
MNRNIRLIQWFFFTVVFGALPLLIRMLLYKSSTRLEGDYVLNLVDIVTFGLVLNVTNINELETRRLMPDGLKAAYKGYSIVAVVFLAAFLGIAYVADLDKSNVLGFSAHNMVNYALVLSVVSCILSFSVVWRT